MGVGREGGGGGGGGGGNTNNILWERKDGSGVVGCEVHLLPQIH